MWVHVQGGHRLCAQNGYPVADFISQWLDLLAHSAFAGWPKQYGTQILHFWVKSCRCSERGVFLTHHLRCPSHVRRPPQHAPINAETKHTRKLWHLLLRALQLCVSWDPTAAARTHCLGARVPEAAEGCPSRDPFLSNQKLCPAGNPVRSNGLGTLKRDFSHLSKPSAFSLGKCSHTVKMILSSCCVKFDIIYLTTFSCQCSCPFSSKSFIRQMNLQSNHFTENKLQPAGFRISRLLLSFICKLQSIAFTCFWNSFSCWHPSPSFCKRSLSILELDWAVRQHSTYSWGGIQEEQQFVQLHFSLILTCIKYSSSKQSTQGSATSIGRTSLEISQHFISTIFSWKRIIL